MVKGEHYHCPHDCESPQPFLAVDGRRLCGRCDRVDDRETEVILCTPQICPEDEIPFNEPSNTPYV